MEPKIIIGTVIAVVLFYFRFGTGSRLLKKKSHHYIVHHASREDPKSIHIEIESNHYDRYILIKNTTDNCLIKGIKEYRELSDNDEFDKYNFGIAKHGDWNVIRIDKLTSFYDFHNLAGWLSEFEESKELPKLTIGFSKNVINSEKDYLFFLDSYNANGDTQIGAFRSGKPFAIYLPDAYEVHGNLTIKKGIKVSFSARIKYLSEQGFNISEIESLKYSAQN